MTYGETEAYRPYYLWRHRCVEGPDKPCHEIGVGINIYNNHEAASKCKVKPNCDSSTLQKICRNHVKKLCDQICDHHLTGGHTNLKWKSYNRCKATDVPQCLDEKIKAVCPPIVTHCQTAEEAYCLGLCRSKVTFQEEKKCMEDCRGYQCYHVEPPAQQVDQGS